MLAAAGGAAGTLPLTRHAHTVYCAACVRVCGCRRALLEQGALSKRVFIVPTFEAHAIGKRRDEAVKAISCEAGHLT